MADRNETVSISYRADIKDLLAELKKMPNVSEAEAKKMVKALDRQFKQMERSVNRASKNSAKSMDRFSASTKRATNSTMKFRKEAANLDRLSGELVVGLGMISEGAGEFAHSASAAASAAESMARAALALNPIGIAIGVTMIAAAGAMFLYNEESQKTEKIQNEIRTALASSEKEIRKQARAADEAGAAFEEIALSTQKLRNQVALLRGEITELDFAKLGIDEQVLKTTSKLTEQRDKQVHALLKQRGALLDTERALERKLKLAKEEQESLLGSNVKHSDIFKLMLLQNSTAKERTAIEEQIKLTIDQTNKTIEKQRRETKDLLTEKIEIEEAERRAEEAAKRRRESLRAFIKEIKEQAKVLGEISKLEVESSKALLSTEDHLQKIEEQRSKIKIKSLETSIKELKTQGDFLKNQEILNNLSSIRSMKEQGILTSYDQQNQKLEAQKEAAQERARIAQETLSKAEEEFLVLEATAKNKKEKLALAELEASLIEARIETAKIEKQSEEEILNLSVQRYKTKEDLERDLHALKMEFSDKEREANRAAIEEALKGAIGFYSQISTLTQTVAQAQIQIEKNRIAEMENNLQKELDAIDELEKKKLISSDEAAAKKESIEDRYNKVIQKKQLETFEQQKQASKAKIIMDSALAAARAFADLPFPAALLTSGIAAAAALAQLKVVDSAPAPQFDIGGMIGSRDPMAPDQKVARVLEGEAVLDRATVQRIGGDQGIRDLQRNGSSGGVVVIQPFKHFDRFVKGARRRGSFSALSTGRGSY